MFPIRLKHILHKTLKDLHSLHTFQLSQDTPGSIYETRLQQTIESILQLLNYDNKISTKLEISVSPAVSDIVPLKLVCFLGSNSANSSDDTDTVTGIDILQYVSSFGEHRNDSSTHQGHQRANSRPENRPTVLDHIIDLLASNSALGRPSRIRDQYSVVITKFSEFIESLITLNSEYEALLVAYLCRCYHHDLLFYADLQNKLESNINLDSEDSQKLVNLLDEYVGSDGVNDNHESLTELDDSMFSYDNIQRDSSGSLNFSCTNKDLERAYFIFLHILSAKEHPLRDVRKYVKVMVNMVKKRSGIEYFGVESEDYSQKRFDIFRSFLVGTMTPNDSPLLRSEFSVVNERSLERLHHFISSGNDLFEHESWILGSQANPNPLDEPGYAHDLNISEPGILQPLSLDDQRELYGNLVQIIDQINEFENFRFDSAFPAILRYYLKLLYNDLPMLVISDDFEYVNNIVRLVNNFVDFENKPDGEKPDEREAKVFKDDVFEFNQLHKWLSPNYVKNEETTTLLMRLAVLEFSKKNQSKQIIFYLWKSKLESQYQLETSLSQKWTPSKETSLKEKYLNRWFAKIIRYQKLEDETRSYYDRSLLDRYIYQWNTALNEFEDMNMKADLFFKKRFLAIYRSRYSRVNDAYNIFQKMQNEKLLKRYLFLWKKRQHHINDIRQRADDKNQEFRSLNDQIILSHIMNHWYESTNKRAQIMDGIDLGSKLKKLSALESTFLKTIHLRKWKRAYKLQVLMIDVQDANNRSLLSFVFKETWLKKWKLNMVAARTIEQVDSSIKESFFKYWRDSFVDIKKGNTYNEVIVLRRYLQLWHQQTAFHQKLIQYEASNQIFDKNKYFSVWKLAHRLSNFKKTQDKKLVEGSLRVWARKLVSNKISEINSSKITDQKLLQDQFQKWKDKLRKLSKLAHNADIIIQRKFFLIYTERMRLYHSQFLEADSFKKNYNFQDKITMALVLRKWQLSYKDRFEKKSSQKIYDFENNIIKPHIRRKYFVAWIERFNDDLSKKHILELQLENYKRGGSLVQKTLSDWRAKLTFNQALRDKADALKTKLLVKKSLVLWYENYLNKTIYFNEIADDFINNKDIQKLRDIISKWSMTYIKVIKRNEQSCDLFIERWQSAHLKSIWDLWVLKARERHDHGLSGDSSFDVSNSTFMSTSSPLASRNYMTYSKGSPIRESGDNYFNTPLRQQFGKGSFATPGTSRLSPTKLQETTQRLKYEKIDAYRKHLGRARGSTPRSSPEKRGRSSLSFDKSSDYQVNTKDSRSTRTQFTSILPPDPPVFAQKIRDNAKISNPPPGYISLGNGTSAEDEPETVTVETAKHLRRITPIMFPTDDEINQPIFSPASSLKSRLSQAGAPQ
ncbi:Sfi1 spindle body protein-domain-containing protein [Scheffersomyces xylosifermentans]|uniref:Sfi1 spindle body protein-domain-containing protein n=1 Tax=Scheffersomyces xylosifermentans TaxID=1304137 RepID=UPI00315DB9AC